MHNKGLINPGKVVCLYQQIQNHPGLIFQWRIQGGTSGKRPSQGSQFFPFDLNFMKCGRVESLHPPSISQYLDAAS